MSILPIRTTTRFVLWFSVICALILIPTALVVYWSAHSGTGNVLLGIVLVVAVVTASVAVGVLATFLFVRLLRRLILNVRSSVPYHDPLASPPYRLSALLNELDHLSKQIATAQQSLRRRNSELEVVATISRALNRVSSLREMLDTALKQTSNWLSCEKGYVALKNEETGEFRILASQGYTPEELDDQSIDVVRDGISSQSVNLLLRATSGVIGVFHLETQPPDQHSQRLVYLLAEILATAVEKHRLLEATQREVRAQRLLNEAGRVLTSTLDKQEVLTRIMREVIQVLNAEAGSVLLVDEQEGDMYFAAAASPAVDLLLGTRMAMDQGIVGWAIQRREPVLVADAYSDPRFYRQIDRQTGLETRSLLCVPLISKGNVIGAIEVMDPGAEKFSAYDLQLLESLAPQAAIAIVNASLHENIKAQMEELERTQDQLLQAEKLSAIGQLVAGVAHELNNPLTAIVGYSQLLLETCQDEGICQDLKRIDREAQRSAHIVQNLLAFARQQKMEKRPLELGDVLNKTIALLAYQLEVDNITLVREIAPDPITVLGDMYQLQQVFLNIISNAHHEMRKAHSSGTLSIRAYPTEQDTVRIQFIDDGPGIPKENVSRIFDPFFTTKDVGEGTGLGLSICLGIVQEHQGRIWAESEFGQGATFTIELPLYQGTPEMADSAKAFVGSTRIGMRSILVVDDEVEITLLLKRVLEAAGHTVTAVNSGLQAREVLEGQTFDLVICDLKMPGISGRELYQYLKQSQPNLAQRVIFSTGDVVSDESWTFLQEVENCFISKPFKPEQVLTVIEEMWTY